MKLTRRQLRQLILEQADVVVVDQETEEKAEKINNDKNQLKKQIADDNPDASPEDVDSAYEKIKSEQNEAITLMKKPMHSHDSVSIVDFMGKPDHEGKMAYKQLKRTSSMAQSLCHRLEDKENIQLPAWVQSKITKAADYIQSVYNYLDEDLD